MRLKVDEDIYLNEDRSRTTKKCFMDLGALLRENYRAGATLLDVGCATGELVKFVQDEFPDLQLSGCDVSESMLEKARCLVPSADFYYGSIADGTGMTLNSYDTVTCFGVITIFDDLETPLRNLVSAVERYGRLIIFGNFNVDSIDLKSQVRRSDVRDSEWLQGYNCWSQYTVEKILAGCGRDYQLTWRQFHMDKIIPKTDDPLRAWTFATEDSEFHQRRGSGQLVNQFFLDITFDR